MATMRSLGFSIFSRYDGSGVAAARRDIDGFNGSVNRSTSALNSWHGRLLLAAKAALVFGPALVPIAAHLTAIAGAATAMGASVGGALTIYGAAMSGAIKRTIGLESSAGALGRELAKAKVKLDQMTPGTAHYEKQLKKVNEVQDRFNHALADATPSQRAFIISTVEMTTAWGKFITATQDQTLATATHAVRGLTAGISLLKPILDAVHPSILKVAQDFEKWMKGDSARNYAALIRSSAVPALQNLIAAGKDVINVLGDGFRAFLPRGTQLAQVIRNGAAALKAWSDGGGFQRFLQYVRETSPQVKEFFRALWDAMKNIGTVMKDLAPVSLALVTAILKVVAALPPGVLEALVIGFMAWRTAVLAVNVAMLLLRANPIILVITAIIAAIYLLVTNWETVSNALKTAWNAVWNTMKVAAEAVWNALKAAWSAFWGAIRTAAETVWGILRTAWGAFVGIFQTAWSAASSVLAAAWNAFWNILRTAAEAVWNFLKLAWETFVKVLQIAWTAVSGVLKTAWEAFWNVIKTVAETVWNFLKLAWETFVKVIQTVWTAVSGVLKTAWEAFWNVIKTVAETVWNFLKLAWETFVNVLQSIWNAVKAAFTGNWSAAWNAIKAAAETVWNALKTAWQMFLDAVKQIWETVSNALKIAWNAVWNAIKTAAETVWNAIKTAWQMFLDAVKQIWETVSAALKTAWETVWNAIKTAAQTVWDALKQAWQTFIDAIKSAWDAFSGFFQDAWNAVWNAAKDTAEKIWHTIGEVIESAVNAIIGVINGIIDAWNTITSAVGLDSLNIGEVGTVSLNFAVGGVVGEVPQFEAGGVVNFARGGVLPGYAPGRDTVPAMLSRGEGILVPEAVKGLGANFVHAANYHFSHGRGGRNVAFPGYAGGGIAAYGRDPFNKEGWGTSFFQGGGVVDPDNPGVVGPGGIIVGGEASTSPDAADVAVGDGDPLGIGVLTDGLGNIAKTGAMVLGFIGRAAIEAAFASLMSTLDGFGEAGNFGKIIAGGTKKILLDMIEMLVSKDEEAKQSYTAMSVAGAQSVQAWAPLAAQALAMAGINPNQLQAFLALMAAESGGNPNAINLWDVNAANGVPSQGLMQVIPTTFAAHHVPGTSNNILDPLANMAASAAYIKSRYGGVVPGSPYADGTDSATPGAHLVGEEGPELVTGPGYAMFGGGEQVFDAAQTQALMAPPAMPAPSGGTGGGNASGDPMELLEQLIEAAMRMREAVATAWTAVVSSGKSGWSALAGVHSGLINEVGTGIPGAFTAMKTASATAWTGMTTQTLANWAALKAGPYTEAQTTATVAVPTALAAMATANGTQWTKMNTDTTTQWGLMRDTTFTEANDFIAVKMPTWADEMNTGVSTSFQNMNEATAESWGGMQEATRAPVNWIIENAYNNGLANLWNQVAEVIFEDGAKTLPTVATLAKGGPVNGPGTATSDSIPARLSRGEHVWTAREVQAAGGHSAVQALRSSVLDGHKVRGAHSGRGFAAGGWVAGSDIVSGSMGVPALGELKRGFLMDEAEPYLDALDSGVRGALAGNSFRKMGAISGALSPSDWMRQYIEKDDELNKIGSGGPPWIPGVSDAITSWGGVTVNQRTADMLNMAVALGGSFSATQGSFSTGVAASAGTHDGGGVVDLVPTGDGNVGALRAVGFAAWNRGAAYGSPSFSPHIHAVALGDPTVSPGAAAQIQSYLAGGNGLADGGPDNFGGGIPAADGVAAIGGGGRNVDPADLEQRVVAFDRGGWWKPGTFGYNGTGRMELATPADDLADLANGIKGVANGRECNHVEINFNGPVSNAQDVRRAAEAAIPRIRQAIQAGTGKRTGG